MKKHTFDKPMIRENRVCYLRNRKISFKAIFYWQVLEIFLQYSLAGASVRECPLAMQEELITSYLGKVIFFVSVFCSVAEPELWGAESEVPVPYL